MNIALTVLAGLGCVQAAPPGEFVSPCGDGGVLNLAGECVSQCVDECLSDRDCDGGFCMHNAGGCARCSDTASELDAGPCPDGGSFNPATGQCTFGCFDGCVSDADCPNGVVCAIGSSGCGECVIPDAGMITQDAGFCGQGASCRTDSECCAGTLCNGGTGCGGPAPLEECSSSSPCDGGLVCNTVFQGPCAQSHICEAPCTSTSCGPVEFCAPDGTCQPLQCPQEFTCPANETCTGSGDEHGCAQIPCKQDSDCPASQFCVNAACEQSIGTCSFPPE